MIKVYIFLLGLEGILFSGSSASPSYDYRLHRPVLIRPTYRPPPQDRPVIRTVRSTDNETWLYKAGDVIKAPTTADHLFLPTVIDDVRMDPKRRYARSLQYNEAETLSFGEDIKESEENIRSKRSFDSPSSKHHGGGNSRPSSSRDPGPSHPGYNRRNTRDIHTSSENVDILVSGDDNEILKRITRSVDSPSAKRDDGNSRSSGSRDTGVTSRHNRRKARDIRLPFDDMFDPFRFPSPFNPSGPRPLTIRPIPIYVRAKRDAQDSLFKKPTHRDVVIPNWNPNARVNPWQRIGVKIRN